MEYHGRRYYAFLLQTKNVYGYPVYQVHDVPDDIIDKVIKREYPEPDPSVKPYLHFVKTQQVLGKYPVVTEYVEYTTKDGKDDLIILGVSADDLKKIINKPEWEALIDIIYQYKTTPALHGFCNYSDSTQYDYYELFWGNRLWGMEIIIGFDLKNNVVIYTPKHNPVNVDGSAVKIVCFLTLDNVHELMGA